MITMTATPVTPVVSEQDAERLLHLSGLILDKVATMAEIMETLERLDIHPQATEELLHDVCLNISEMPHLDNEVINIIANRAMKFTSPLCSGSEILVNLLENLSEDVPDRLVNKIMELIPLADAFAELREAMRMFNA